MPTVLLCGEPHGQFEHIVAEVERCQPVAVLLLGDWMPLGLSMKNLMRSWGKTRVLWDPWQSCNRDREQLRSSLRVMTEIVSFSWGG